MIKDFIELKPKEWQAAFHFYSSLSSALSPSEKEYCMLSYLLQQKITEKALQPVATRLISTFDLILSSASSSTSQNIIDTDFCLSVQDVNFLSTAISLNTSGAPKELFYLLTAYAVYARAYPHPNGWIKCDSKSKETLFHIASCSKLSTKQKEALTNTLHSIYNLNMRVIGSNQPIPCFQFPWQVSQPVPVDDINSENPLVSIGPQTPDSIKKFVDTFYVDPAKTTRKTSRKQPDKTKTKTKINKGGDPLIYAE